MIDGEVVVELLVAMHAKARGEAARGVGLEEDDLRGEDQSSEEERGRE